MVSNMENIRTGIIGEGSGAVVARLGFSTEKPVFSPEMTSKRKNKNHDKHARDMGLTHNQWKKAAAALLNDGAKENYFDWENPGAGTFSRFDITRGVLAVGDKDGTINTFFILRKKNYKYYLPDVYIEKITGKR